MFEAQIKAKDEMTEMVKQQQMDLQLQDPATAAAYQYYQQQGFIDYPQGEYAAAPGEVLYQDAAGMPVSAPYQDGGAVMQMPPGPGIPMAVPQGTLEKVLQLPCVNSFVMIFILFLLFENDGHLHNIQTCTVEPLYNGHPWDWAKVTLMER